MKSSSYVVLCSVVLFLAACAHCPVITPCIFENAQVGDSIEEVLSCGGQPYYVGDCETEGQKEYIYVSRHELAPEVYEHRNWVFVVDDDGTIVNKWICEDHYFDLLNRDAPAAER